MHFYFKSFSLKYNFLLYRIFFVENIKNIYIYANSNTVSTINSNTLDKVHTLETHNIPRVPYIPNSTQRPFNCDIAERTYLLK